MLLAGNVGFSCGGTTDFMIQSVNGMSDDPVATPSCNVNPATNTLVPDAMIGPLASNGGPTLTHALLTGSPAIDAGGEPSCPATDQRGTIRPVGGACDIGAFEGTAAPPPPPPPPPLRRHRLPHCSLHRSSRPRSPASPSTPRRRAARVKIKLPGTSRFVVLDEQQLPVGTTVDATKGRVTLVAAADNKGGTATADFYDGIFKIGQTKGAAPITTLTLVEKLSCPKRGKASAAAAKKKKRRLWGDGKGRFRTQGSYSSATVRGTTWLVEDTLHDHAHEGRARVGHGARLRQEEERDRQGRQEVRRQAQALTQPTGQVSLLTHRPPVARIAPPVRQRSGIRVGILAAAAATLFACLAPGVASADTVTVTTTSTTSARTRARRPSARCAGRSSCPPRAR